MYSFTLYSRDRDLLVVSLEAQGCCSNAIKAKHLCRSTHRESKNKKQDARMVDFYLKVFYAMQETYCHAKVCLPPCYG
jgi:hypothetical protein